MSHYSLTVNDPDTVPPREALDFRALQVLFDIIARTDRECIMPAAIARAARLAHDEHDDALACWLHDAVLQIRDRRRLFDSHMADPEATR